MISYRFRRRAFLTAASGGIGLKIMLRTLEGSAQGLRSPPRLLVTHWPVGIVAGSGEALWRPTSGSVAGSPALQVFADHGLAQDMTVIRGLSTPIGSGGGHEAGTVGLVTGVAAPGTRSGEQEADDAYAGGPSIDQYLLKNAPALQTPGPGYANSASDSRTDFGEVSTKCLSYSTEFQSVAAALGPQPATEAKPLMPVLSPLMQYTNLFGSFSPGTGGAGGSGGGQATGAAGGGGRPVADAMLKNLVGRRSVLDFAIEELNQVKRLAPSQARDKLAIHTNAVVAAENSVVSTINARYPNVGGSGSGGAGGTPGGNGDPLCGGSCSTKPAAPGTTVGLADKSAGLGNPFGANGNVGVTDDSPVLALVGMSHLSVLKAAFICDLIRVGTYQWTPGTNHTSFGGLFPGDARSFLHHPTSHKINTSDTVASVKLTDLNPNAQFLFNVQVWYFSRHAENFADWKNSVDGCGNSLLDFTCVPFVTEVGACGHERNNMPAMIIGGTQLGFLHGRYVSAQMSVNAFWGTIAQAYGTTSTAAPLGAPVAGFWSQP